MSTINSNVPINSEKGLDGNSYTTSISNDTLSNDDFMQLMLTELSLQDPTKPMDSSAMMDNQLKMSTVQANLDSVAAMEKMVAQLSQSSLADSANMIGRIVENGQMNGEDPKQYQVSSITSEDGTIYATANEILGYDDMYHFEPISDPDSQIENGNDDGDSLVITTKDGTTHEFSTVGKSYNDLAKEISEINGLGADVVELADGTSQLVVAVSGGGSNIAQKGIDDIKYNKDQQVIFAKESTMIDYTDITKIY